MKICVKCKIEKTLFDFNKNKSKNDGIDSECKLCKKQRGEIYYKKNREKILERTKKRELETGYLKKWREKNKGYSSKYILKRRKEDCIFKFKHNLRSLIKSSFKRGKNQFNKNAKTETILGCTIEEFRSYIENKFTDGMYFYNYSEWHLDHIIPLASATTEEEIIKLNHYTNFQPLWAKDNFKKGSKIIIE